MKLIVPQSAFDVPIDRIACLHVPQNWDSYSESAEDLLQRLSSESKMKAVICRPAFARRRFLSLLRPETTQNWLERNSGLASDEAARWIKALPVRVDPILQNNAGNPRAGLGIVAAFALPADLYLYNFRECDPSGCEALHQFVDTHRAGRRIVHLSWPAFYGSGNPAPRFCPPRSACIEVPIEEAGFTPLK
jgi:hypothetical protein